MAIKHFIDLKFPSGRSYTIQTDLAEKAFNMCWKVYCTEMLLTLFCRDEYSGDTRHSECECEWDRSLTFVIGANALQSIAVCPQPLFSALLSTRARKIFWDTELLKFSFWNRQLNSTDFILGDSFMFSPWLYNFNILWQLYFRSRPRHCFKNLRNASITRTRNWRLEKSLEIPASVCPPSDLRHVDPGAWPLPVSSVRSKGQCQDWSEEAIAGHRAWAGNTLQC